MLTCVTAVFLYFVHVVGFCQLCFYLQSLFAFAFLPFIPAALCQLLPCAFGLQISISIRLR
jgi:hypothetical protein